MVFPIFQGGCLGAGTFDGKLCIGDMSFWNLMQKFIKPMRNINIITCGCKTCIISMLFQSDINKWRASQLSKIDKLSINYASTIIL